MIVQQIERIRLEWMTTMIWDPSTMTMKDKQSMIEYLLSSKLFCPLISCSCDGNAQKSTKHLLAHGNLTRLWAKLA